MKDERAGDSDPQWKYGIMWNESWETGHEQIDEQHKELFRLASDLIEACEQGSNVQTVDKALDFLASYVVRHFADEETLMTQSDYPAFEEHKNKHEDFKQTVAELARQFQESGSSSDLSHKINSIVIQWLITHISMLDRNLAYYVRSAGKQRSF